jgi:hypothetical protein
MPSPHKRLPGGNSGQMNNYGHCLQSGLGVAQDQVVAARHSKMSADSGNSDGMFHYGRCLMYGFGVDENAIVAARYFTMSADASHSHGMFHDGRCLELGRGVDENAIGAARYYKYPLIQAILMECFIMGVVWNLVEALMKMRLVLLNITNIR